MTIEEIYRKFDAIGCLSFATINEDGEPESRIAHLRAFDHQGLYFMTMYTKDFYRDLKAHKSLSICGLCADTQIAHDDKGLPLFQAGYAIRLTGQVEEVSMAEILEKKNPIFDLCIKDKAQYPAMVVFCITAGRGDIFDYDFEKIHRDHKLQRHYFSYHGKKIKYKGLHISLEACISCGICKEKCSFMAIAEDDTGFHIDKHRCDECGDCYVNCPSKAISYRGEKDS